MDSFADILINTKNCTLILNTNPKIDALAQLYISNIPKPLNKATDNWAEVYDIVNTEKGVQFMRRNKLLSGKIRKPTQENINKEKTVTLCYPPSK